MSASNPASSWGPLVDVAMLAFEAQEVIGLRLLKFAQGGIAAGTEALQMVEEKIEAVTAATSIMTSATLQGRPEQGADDVLRMLRQKVRANRVRLTK